MKRNRVKFAFDMGEIHNGNVIVEPIVTRSGTSFSRFMIICLEAITVIACNELISDNQPCECTKAVACLASRNVGLIITSM
jgi:hypothetical protein